MRLRAAHSKRIEVKIRNTLNTLVERAVLKHERLPPPQRRINSFYVQVSEVKAIISVVDPDPWVFGPPGPGPGSVSQRYRSGSESFYHQAKKLGKTLIPTVLCLLYDFIFLKVKDENSRIRSRIRIRW